MQKFSALLLCALMLIGVVGANAQDPAEAEIRLALANPAALDPVSLSRFAGSERDLIENLYIGLTRLNARSGQIEPWLAESWTVSDDGLTWTFNLRDDVQWVRWNAAGNAVEAVRPVVAADVVFAIQRGCDPLRPSPVTDNLFIIRGCRSYRTVNSIERPPLDSIGVSALDDRTLEFNLLLPAGYFLTLTSLPEYRPLPSEFVDDALGLWWQPDLMLSSGAWAAAGWSDGASLRLVANPFWPFERGNISALDIRFNIPIDTLSTAITGGTYAYAALDSATASVLNNQAGDLLRAKPGHTLMLLGFSFGNIDAEGLPVASPTDNAAVRRALALALDRPTLATNVYQNRARASDHFTPRSAQAAPSTPGASFDPEAARGALAAAGYANCQGLGVLQFAVSENPQDQLLAQNIVSQWIANLGCLAETFPIIAVPRQALIDSAHNTINTAETSRYPLWLLSWTADYPDAQAWVTDALFCEDGYFRPRGVQLCGATDNLMRQASASFDPVLRFNAYNQIETDLFGRNGSFPVIPLLIDQIWWAQAAELANVGGYGPLQFDRWVWRGE